MKEEQKEFHTKEISWINQKVFSFSFLVKSLSFKRRKDQSILIEQDRKKKKNIAEMKKK